MAPEYADRVRRDARHHHLDERFVLTGRSSATTSRAATRPPTCSSLASRTETYGMVVTEALSRGIPVIASDVGGVPEALGAAADGTRPGVLVPPE